jgi:hypothetical protein
MTTATADWCVQSGSVSISGTHMEESSRRSEGIRWCFVCRKRHEFWWVVMTPAGISYYGPTAHMEGISRRCSDLFPGWAREAIEE